MEKTQQLIEMLQMLRDQQFWSERDRNLMEVQLGLRRIQYIYSRLRRDHFHHHKVYLTDAELKDQESAAEQRVNNATSSLDAQFNQFVELKQLTIELYPQLLGKLPIVDRANFERLDPTAVMPYFSELLGQVLHLDTENYRETRSPDEWERLFDISHSTFKRQIEAGKIRVKEHTTKSVSVHCDDVVRLTKK